jgi:hypothetical protein
VISQTDEERALGLNVFLLSFSVACALFIGGLIYVLKNGARWNPVNDSTYLALTGAYRVVDFLHLQAVSPVKSTGLRRQLPSGTERVGIEICIFVTVLGLTAATSLLLSLFTYMQKFRSFVKRSTLMFLLFAAPASYLTVSRLTWSWPTSEPYSIPHGSFSESLPLRVFIGEIACLCVLLTLPYLRRRVIPKWTVATLILFHLAFWMYVLWHETRIWLFPIYSLNLVLLLIPVLPLVYMLQDRDRLVRARGRLKTRWVLGIAIVALSSFVAVWVPSKTVALSHPEDLAAVKIELSRGPCFGPCPRYTIAVQGDGRVEYLGRQRYSRFDSRKVGKIEREKITQILQTLDQVKFMTLEDRAFSWGFDTPSVGVRIWEDGKTKRVVSDAGFVGSKNGRQSRFVDATQEIDSILKSTRWDSCEGEECVSPPSTEPTPD